MCSVPFISFDILPTALAEMADPVKNGYKRWSADKQAKVKKKRERGKPEEDMQEPIE